MITALGEMVNAPCTRQGEDVGNAPHSRFEPWGLYCSLVAYGVFIGLVVGRGIWVGI